MADDDRSQELPQRVRSAARAGPAPPAPSALPEELRQRIRAAVTAERGEAFGRDQKLAPEPELRTTTSGPADRRVMGPAGRDARRAIRGESSTEFKPSAELVKSRHTMAPVEPEPPAKPQRNGSVPASHKPGGARRMDRSAAPHESAHKQSGRRRSVMTALVATTLVVIAVGSLGLAATRYVASLRSVSHPLSPQQRLEAAIRSRAAAWIVQYVSHSAIVSCDQVMCGALEADGFPSHNLHVVVPTAPNLASSGVVVATSAVRDLIGLSLSSFYAPQVLATIGSGDAEITIRLTAATAAAAQADLNNRKAFGANLLQLLNGKTVSARARELLLAGQVDSRLLVAIVTLASMSQPIDIVGFGNVGSGASGAGDPLRYADVAVTDRAADMTIPAYAQSIRADLGKILTAANTASVKTVRLTSGQTVLQIAFTVPSPSLAEVQGSSKSH